MSTVSTVDLHEGGGQDDTKQKTKDRLAKWYREHGKAKRGAAKRTRHPEPTPCDAEDQFSGDEDYPPRSVRRTFTHEQTEHIRDLIWEEQQNKEPSTTSTLLNGAVCVLGALGIGRAALENREVIVNTASGFLAQLVGSSTGKQEESATPSSVSPLEAQSSTVSQPLSSSEHLVENVDE